MTENNNTVYCPTGHPNDAAYVFCSVCGLRLEPVAASTEVHPPHEVVVERATEAPNAPQISAGPQRVQPGGSGHGSARKIAIISVVIALIVGAGVGGYFALRGSTKSSAMAQAHRTTTKSHLVPVPSLLATPSPSGAALTWQGYKSVHLGEDMVAAASALGGTSTGDCPPPNGTYDIITGIPKDLVITDEGAGTANVSVIQLTGQDDLGPDGIRAGMTIAQARAVSGQPLIATTSPTTGQHIYTITSGSAVFAFLGDPLVSDLTLTTPAEIQQGILGGGGGGC